jgi:mannose-6-phosphate isomerase-like protein (cupin superfamily)
MKRLHIADLPIETTHGNTLSINRIVSIGQSKTKLQTLNRAWLEPRASMEAHSHPDCEEIFYFLEGTGEMHIDKKIVSVSKDDVVIVDPGEIHGINNTSSNRLLYLSMRILL